MAAGRGGATWLPGRILILPRPCSVSEEGTLSQLLSREGSCNLLLSAGRSRYTTSEGGSRPRKTSSFLGWPRSATSDPCIHVLPSAACQSPYLLVDFGEGSFYIVQWYHRPNWANYGPLCACPSFYRARLPGDTGSSMSSANLVIPSRVEFPFESGNDDRRGLKKAANKSLCYEPSNRPLPSGRGTACFGLIPEGRGPRLPYSALPEYMWPRFLFPIR